MKFRSQFLLLPLLVISFWGCKIKSSTSALAGYTLKNKSVRWPSNHINVCWERESTGSEKDRESIKQAVMTDYARTATERFEGLIFDGWNNCSPGDRQGIRILFGAQSPQTRALGAFISGLRNGMLLPDTINSDGCAAGGEYSTQRKMYESYRPSRVWPRVGVAARTRAPH